MQRWEDRSICVRGGGEKSAERLNRYGGEGWELVCVWFCWHYLKRALAR